VVDVGGLESSCAFVFVLVLVLVLLVVLVVVSVLVLALGEMPSELHLEVLPRKRLVRTPPFPFPVCWCLEARGVVRSAAVLSSFSADDDEDDGAVAEASVGEEAPGGMLVDDVTLGGGSELARRFFLMENDGPLLRERRALVNVCARVAGGLTERRVHWGSDSGLS
jgi:hypothetical protein